MGIEVGLVGLVYNVGNYGNNEEFLLYIKSLMNVCGFRNICIERELVL